MGCKKCGDKETMMANRNTRNQALKAAASIASKLRAQAEAQQDIQDEMNAEEGAQVPQLRRNINQTGKFYIGQKYPSYEEAPEQYVKVRIVIQDNRLRTVRGIKTRLNYGDHKPGEEFYMHVDDYQARPQSFKIVAERQAGQNIRQHNVTVNKPIIRDKKITVVKEEDGTPVTVPESLIEWLTSYKGIGPKLANTLVTNYGVEDRASFLALGAEQLYEVEGFRRDYVDAILTQMQEEVDEAENAGDDDAE